MTGACFEYFVLVVAVALIVAYDAKIFFNFRKSLLQLVLNICDLSRVVIGFKNTINI